MATMALIRIQPPVRWLCQWLVVLMLPAQLAFRLLYPTQLWAFWVLVAVSILLMLLPGSLNLLTESVAPPDRDDLGGTE